MTYKVNLTITLITLLVSGSLWADEILQFDCTCEGYVFSVYFLQRMDEAGIAKTKETLDDFSFMHLSCAGKNQNKNLILDSSNDFFQVDDEILNMYREPRKFGGWVGDIFAVSSSVGFRIVGSRCNEECFHDEYILNLNSKNLYVNSNTIAGYVELGTDIYSCAIKN